MHKSPDICALGKVPFATLIKKEEKSSRTIFKFAVKYSIFHWNERFAQSLIIVGTIVVRDINIKLTDMMHFKFFLKTG